MKSVLPLLVLGFLGCLILVVRESAPATAFFVMGSFTAIIAGQWKRAPDLGVRALYLLAAMQVALGAAAMVVALT